MKTVLPEVKAFHEAIDAAQAVYLESDQDNQAFTARSKARIAAWDKLGESENPIVCQLAEHHRVSYRTEAILVLDALPMTEAELEKFGKEEHDWCDTFDDWMDELRELGAFPGSVPPSPARRALSAYLRDNDLSRSEIKRVNELVDAVVAEATVAV